MNGQANHVLPVLLLVSGAPASGKSTLAAKISAELGWPLIAKDEVKELLADTLDVSGIEWSRRLGAATFQLIDRFTARLLASGVSLILEANFDPRFEDQEFRRLVRAGKALVIEVFCRADADVLLARYRQRGASGERHPIHVDGIYGSDEGFQRRLKEAFRAPIGLGGPIVEVDTTDFGAVDEQQILAVVRAAIEAG